MIAASTSGANAEVERPAERRCHWYGKPDEDAKRHLDQHGEPNQDAERHLNRPWMGCTASQIRTLSAVTNSRPSAALTGTANKTGTPSTRYTERLDRQSVLQVSFYKGVCVNTPKKERRVR